MPFRLLRGLLLALVFCASALSAQTIDTADYETWARTADRAEQAIEAGRASDGAMQGLRAELVQWRQKFSDAQTVNAKTITSVQAQLDTLGPPPDIGSEPEDIAAQRQGLNDRLAELRAPAQRAEVAFSRANGLVSAIDGLLRERQAEALLERGPTPFNPSIWYDGWVRAASSFRNTWIELESTWRNPTQKATLKANLPGVIVLVVIGIVLLAMGRRWMMRLGMAVQARRTTPARWLAAFVLSLGQVILPLIGLNAILQALYVAGLVGIRLDPLIGEIRAAGLILFFSLWIGSRVFPRSIAVRHPLELSPERQREGRLVTGLIGLVLALERIVSEFARYDNWSAADKAVVFFPLIVVGATMIFRLGQLLKSHGEAALEHQAGDENRPAGDTGYSERLYKILGRGLAIVAFVGPVLAGLGYFEAGKTAVFALLQSMMLLAFVLIVQRVLAELYVLIRRDETVRDGLVPVLTGLTLIIVAAPRFAVIWGVSENQLNEFWLKLREGFVVGDIKVTPTAFLTLAVIFTIGLLATRLLQGALKNTVLPKTKMDGGAQTALVSGIGYIGIFIAALTAITAAGIDLTALGYVAGALSVGIGFGLQNIVSNFVSGIILLIERPISEGDWIEVGGQMGYVRDISVRSTRIETFDRTDVIVPNADFVSGTVTNYTRGNTIGRVIVPVGVAYGTDTRKVETILREIAQAHPMVLSHPPPIVVFQGFGADSLDFEIRAILRDVNWVLSVKSDMNHEIARRFIEEGIEIPFAQRDIWIRNPEALRAPVDPVPEFVDPDADSDVVALGGGETGEAKV